MDHLLGKRVKNEIANSKGLTLIPARSTLNHDHIELLANHKIDPHSIVFVSEDEETHRQSINKVVNADGTVSFDWNLWENSIDGNKEGNPPGYSASFKSHECFSII